MSPAASSAVGLPMVEDGGLNLLIGVSDHEHDYVRRMVMGNNKSQGHQHRPAGFTHLQSSARPVNLFSAAGRSRSGRRRCSRSMIG